MGRTNGIASYGAGDGTQDILLKRPFEGMTRTSGRSAATGALMMVVLWVKSERIALSLSSTCWFHLCRGGASIHSGNEARVRYDGVSPLTENAIKAEEPAFGGCLKLHVGNLPAPALQIVIFIVHVTPLHM